MENTDGNRSDFRSFRLIVNPAWLGDDVIYPFGLVCDDGVVVERVSLDGLELVAIEFRAAA